MSIARALVLLCFAVGLHGSCARDITSSVRQAETPLMLIANDFVLKGQTQGATCPVAINIKTVRPYRGSSFEQEISLSDPVASRLPLGEFFGTVRVSDVIVSGTQCTGNAETIILAPANVPRLIGLLEAAPSSPTRTLSEYGTLLRGVAKHALDSTKAVGTLLSENNKPVRCGTHLYPAFVFFLTDIANDKKQLAARLNLNSADQMKGNLILVTSAKVPLSSNDLLAFENGSERLCAYGVSGKPVPASPASASSSAGTSGNGASASANANPGAQGADATASTSGDSRRGPSTSTSTSGNGASASADASQGTGPRANAETSGASQPGASSSTSTSGPGASASADANAGAGPTSIGGSASSSSESSDDGTDGGSVSCRKSTSQQGSGSSSASCR